MAMLTEDYDALAHDGILIEQPVKEGCRIYKNSLVCLDKTGGTGVEVGLVPAEDKTDYIFAGVSYEGGKNPAQMISEDVILKSKIRVLKAGVFEFDFDGTASNNNLGDVVYIIDDHTVGTSSTNNIACGTIVKIISATKVAIRINNYTK